MSVHAQTYLTSLPSSLGSHATVHPYHFIKFISDCSLSLILSRMFHLLLCLSLSLSPQCINYSCLSHQLKKNLHWPHVLVIHHSVLKSSLHPHLPQVRPREADLCRLHHSHALKAGFWLSLSNRRRLQQDKRAKCLSPFHHPQPWSFPKHHCLPLCQGCEY